MPSLRKWGPEPKEWLFKPFARVAIENGLKQQVTCMPASKSEKEVLYVWPYLEWGGAQIYFAGIMKLARERYAVRAVMPQGSSERLLSYLKQAEVPCEFFDAHVDAAPATTVWRKLQRRWRNIYTELVIARHLGWQRLKRAILHVEFGPWSSFWFLLYLTLRCHVLVTLHTALPQLSIWRRASWKLKFAILTLMPRFHLLASNREMIESVKPFVPAGPSSRIRLAYSGVDTGEIEQALATNVDHAGMRKKYSLPDGFLVFAMGQLIERKGCWVLLAAAKTLQRTGEDVGFVWLGTGPIDEETRLRLDAYDLNESFRVVTPQEIGNSRQELLSLLRLADAFVLPSFTEGLPLALLEAMALGIPCVASNINAIPEAVTDGETGILVTARDSDALATAIRKLMNDDSTRERIAKAGQRHVLANFDERKTAQITVALYDACFEAI